MQRFQKMISGLIFISFWLLLSSSLHAQSPTTYRVAPENYQEFLTNTVGSLNADDTVLFARGGTYFGALNLTGVNGTGASPITFAADPETSGTDPLFTGLTKIENWTETASGSNRWQAVCDVCKDVLEEDNRYYMINMVLQNGEFLPIGRYPNPDEQDKGYFYWDSAVGNYQITDSEMLTPSSGFFSDANGWEGAELVARTRAWLLDRRPVIDHTDRSLTVTFPPTLITGTNTSFIASSGNPNFDRGYFIQNHPAALDRPGEWFYRGPTNNQDNVLINANETPIITLYSDEDPNSTLIDIEVASFRDVIKVNQSSHLVFRGIDVVGGHSANVKVMDSSFIEFDDVDSAIAGDKAVHLRNSDQIVYKNSEIKDALNLGLYTWLCDGCELTNNTIFNIATIAGMGQGRDGQYLGAYAFGYPILFDSNVVDRVGYIGVNGRGSVILSNNVVSDFNRLKTDGSGIYTNNHGSYETHVTIESNIIRNAEGSTAGIGQGVDIGRKRTATHGIYIDDDIDGTSIIGNTIYNVGDTGIKLHNTNAITIRDNVVIDAQNAQLQFVDNNDDSWPLNVTNNLIRDNWFGATDPVSVLVEALSDDGSSQFSQFGDIDNNTYCDIGNTFMHNIVRWPVNDSGDLNDRTFSTWVNVDGHDENSTLCSLSNKVSNSTFSDNTTYWFGYHQDNLTLTAVNDELQVQGVDGNPAWRHFETTVGAVSAESSYYVRFDIRTDQDDVPIDFYLRKFRDPYNKLTEARTEQIGTATRTIGFIFSPHTSDADSLLLFEVEPTVQNIWIDNVELYEIPRIEPIVPTAISLDGQSVQSIEDISLFQILFVFMMLFVLSVNLAKMVKATSLPS